MLDLSWNTPKTPVPMYRLPRETLEDPSFQALHAQNITQFFSGNSCSTSSHTIEYDAFKMTTCGQYIQEISGVRKMLEREMAVAEHRTTDLKNPAVLDASKKTAPTDTKTQYVTILDQMHCFNFKANEERVHRKGDR
ncbi:hypothetical protein NDU88_003948 [Pleurodeles waltl]|uniref:Uncharacterized protein n=1 Tax=Pleurodeles waltl TaxID=8319 RepID=A0AAV7RED5_PLEWA|nr:hypothetical protein NDU88_003948 [Pleurodeles waltl]